MTIDELQVLITANTTELRKEINKANQNISSLQKSANKGTSGVANAFKKLKRGIIAIGIGKVIKDTITSGMDAIESDSLFETSLGASADAVRSWSDEVSNVLGLNAVAMRKNTGVIYNMTSSMGVAEDSALKMSKGISLLSEDMASFYNLDSAEAFNKLRAGLTGETEPLKALGILVDENTVKQVAYSEGIATVGSELTQQQKVLARYVAILKQTGNAQGDLARTINSPANQLRTLKQQVTNLGVAFSNFLMPVLNAVLPYLTAFTKVVTQALSSLAKFLGISSGGGASEETKKVSENVGGLAGAYDDATKSAKKLKNSLAGFDEMNTLQDNESDSASGGVDTPTVGLDFDLSEYDAHLDWVNSRTNELVEKIESAFSSIGKGIKFNNLIKAFDELKKSLKPFTKTIWDGIKWGLDNVLKPLAKWTIEDVIPAFFNLFGGAIDFVNQVLTDFEPIFTWFWDYVLSPIAEWTGGVVVSVLNGIGDALSWIASNEIAMAIIEGIAIAIGLVTTALGIYNAIILVYTNLTTIATAVSTAFGSVMAFITSPITLVVTAIGALIAIIILCVKHWDEIKEVALSVWNKIKEIWGVVADWIYEYVIQPVAKFFVGLWNGIKDVFSAVGSWFCDVFTGAWEGIKKAFSTAGDFFVKVWELIKKPFVAVGTWFSDIFSGAWDGIKKAFSSVGSFFTGIWDTIKNIFSKVGNVIGDAVSGAFKSAVNWVLEKAVGLINGFISAINFAIGIINKIPGVEIKKVSKLEVPQFAKGGIVDKPTLAVVGEAGKEAVMPLERNTGWIDQLAGKLGDKLGGATGNIKLIVKLGEEAIFDRFIEYGKDKAFETNGEVVFV